MNMRITNLFTHDEVILTDVKSVLLDECEICLYFNEDHQYKSIEEIYNLITPVVGYGIYNYHFRGTDCYGNHSSDNATDLLLAVSSRDLRFYMY